MPLTQLRLVVLPTLGVLHQHYLPLVGLLAELLKS